MSKPVMVKGMNFAEMIQEVQQKGIEAKKELEENGGICLHCKKNMANINSPLNPFHCDECNKVTEELIQQLQGPGFMKMKVPIP